MQHGRAALCAPAAAALLTLRRLVAAVAPAGGVGVGHWRAAAGERVFIAEEALLIILIAATAGEEGGIVVQREAAAAAAALGSCRELATRGTKSA